MDGFFSYLKVTFDILKFNYFFSSFILYFSFAKCLLVFRIDFAYFSDLRKVYFSLF